MSDYFDDVEDAQGGLEGDTEGEPASGKKAAKARRSKAQEALRAELSVELQADPLAILGPDRFDQVSKGLLYRNDTRGEVANVGVIFTDVDGEMRFLFRDDKSRAGYVFKVIMGLTYPCEKTQAERHLLAQAFEDGWARSDLGFLSAVPLGDCEAYRGQL